MGPSNSGKSTLLNNILDEKVSIVSRKVQTTRIRGIFNNEVQIILLILLVFLTPRPFLKRQWLKMLNNLNDADLVYF